jgi:hypothetical protein
MSDHRPVIYDHQLVSTDHRLVMHDHQLVITDHRLVMRDHRLVMLDHLSTGRVSLLAGSLSLSGHCPLTQVTCMVMFPTRPISEVEHHGNSHR